ncbi:dickkopf-related protein 1-like [Gadus chalcogrammus]|uniref:dickkopf-related protein 1-like n=1 Tax=Gadus chalcogrammus TaxID=1042646 RepID=UPI0024C4CBB9|nr:dickkopf-related protein 1-like [Gadus chalcogrammus]
MIQSSVFLATAYLPVMFLSALCSGSLMFNSNAIKNLAPGPGTPIHGAGQDASSSPDEFGLLDGGHHNLLIDPIQALACSADDECGEHGFCYASRGACLPCKRRRKRCARDSMCCQGNQCSNGVCLPMDSDIVQQFTVEEPSASVSSTAGSHGANNHGPSNHGPNNHGPSHGASGHSMNSQENRPDEQNSTTHSTSTKDPHSPPPRGLEGERCLRSSDCSGGLCCARHFWSKICKPVLREGQVCTKHRKKGALGLEIFQRCDCGAGLACRTQRGAEEQRMHKAARALHTCQQH